MVSTLFYAFYTNDSWATSIPCVADIALVATEKSCLHKRSSQNFSVNLELVKCESLIFGPMRIAIGECDKICRDGSIMDFQSCLGCERCLCWWIGASLGQILTSQCLRWTGQSSISNTRRSPITSTRGEGRLCAVCRIPENQGQVRRHHRPQQKYSELHRQGGQRYTGPRIDLLNIKLWRCTRESTPCPSNKFPSWCRIFIRCAHIKIQSFSTQQLKIVSWPGAQQKAWDSWQLCWTHRGRKNSHLWPQWKVKGGLRKF